MKLGEKGIIIGAGNAVMDVARTAMRHGSRNVTCFFLMKKIAASEHKFSYATPEGEEGNLTEAESCDILIPADSLKRHLR